MKNFNFFTLIITTVLVFSQINAQSEKRGLISLNQPSVSIYNMQYVNGQSIGSNESIKITEGTNSRVLFGIILDNPNGWQGTLRVYTKRYSGDSPQLQGGSDYVFSGNTYFTSSKDITLYASNFNSTGGSLYAEFESLGGNKHTSNSYSIEVIVPQDPSITNNVINGIQTVNEGEAVSTIYGSSPNGGNGSYSYIWQKKTTGSWSSISGANQKNHSPNSIIRTTKFRRVVSSGNTQNSISNVIIKTFIQAPPITNNNISFNGSIMVGSNPIGGNGNYTYEWRVSNSVVYDEIIPNANQKDYIVPPSDIANNSFLNSHYKRIVKSVSRTSSTGWLGLNTPITNNTISFNGSIMVGSNPIGGNGNYTYEWRVSNSIVNDEIIPNANQKDYIVPPSDIANNSFLNSHYKRIVKSATLTSSTNWVSICQGCKKSKFKVNVFPNPVTENINFEFNYSKNTRVNISLISLFGRENVVLFKGNIGSGKQIITIQKPPRLSNGMYSYKVITDDNSIVGKIIFK